MIKSNNIDLFLFKEELLNIFLELIPQIKNKNPNFISQFNIIEDFTKKKLNQIIILDEDSLKKLISNKLSLNNYVFIIGKINEKVDEYLNANFINFESFETPISFLKLLNRCDNLLSEIHKAQSEIIDLKKLSYSFNLNTIFLNNSSLYLTDKENEIFHVLIKNVGNSFTRKELLSKVWSYNENIDTHTLETHIYTLRSKIKKKFGLTNLILHEEDGYRIKV
ncbi:winged helix-turn-helix domain-containing protein [Pelagibacteraceae bacterium]|nr:winged helix-turn-helix domain-containing protein [Pelagibacteraceae bacterium]